MVGDLDCQVHWLVQASESTPRDPRHRKVSPRRDEEIGAEQMSEDWCARGVLLRNEFSASRETSYNLFESRTARSVDKRKSPDIIEAFSGS
jgi:hypothetical protein